MKLVLMRYTTNMIYIYIYMWVCLTMSENGAFTPICRPLRGTVLRQTRLLHHYSGYSYPIGYPININIQMICQFHITVHTTTYPMNIP